MEHKSFSNRDMKSKLHEKAFRMYGDSCYLIFVKRKEDVSKPLSDYEYYWSMRILEFSSDDCIALLFCGAGLSDFVFDLEELMGKSAYVSSCRYFCEITCCSYNG